MDSLNKFPLVTVVTPSYNQAAYLEDTICTVLAQDYPNLEYMIVDGGSTDGSVEIIKEYAHKLAWWVSEPDSGQADAINKGLARARGDIVAWLNSDDLYLPGAIEAAVAGFQADTEVGLVFGDAITIDAQGRPLNHLDFGDWSLNELMRFRIICQPAVFMRKSVLEQVGYLDTNYHYCLDHHLWLRIASSSGVLHISEPWAAARHHPLAKNVAESASFGVEALRIVDWMETQPEFAARLAKDRQRINGGVYRLNARYLLDGGMPGPALKSYWRAILAWPQYAFQHWHRMVFALLSLVGGSFLADWYYRFTGRNRPRLDGDSRLVDWPGINWK